MCALEQELESKLGVFKVKLNGLLLQLLLLVSITVGYVND